MIALAETLREARQNAGLTQRQVADALAVPHTYPSRWERGVTRPGPANLLALAELYSLDAADLLRMYAGAPAAAAAAPEPAPARTRRRSTKDADAAAALSAAVADAAAAASPPRRRRRASAGGGAATGS